MFYKSITLSAVLILMLASASVWDSVENIGEAEVFTDMRENGIYIPQHKPGPIPLPGNDPQSEVPPELLNQLDVGGAGENHHNNEV